MPNPHLDSQTRALGVMFRHSLDTPGDGDSTTALGSPF